MNRIELWILIKLLQRRLRRMLSDLDNTPNEWTHYRNELIDEINELKYLLSGLYNEQNNE